MIEFCNRESRTLCLMLAALFGGRSTTALAETPPKATDVAKTPADKTSGLELVRVNGKPIFDADVDRMLAKSGAIAAADRTNPLFRAAVLNQLVDRRLVQDFLVKSKVEASPQEVEVEIARLKAELDRSKQTLDQLLARTGQTDASLRAELAWELSWQRYVKQQITDESLEAFFNAHHLEFDGSELHVGHILLRPTVAGDDAALASLVKQAIDIRQQILDKKITFEAAAAKYSAGPSREKGGDLGYIGRHGPMVEPFNRAAFALGKDDISPPVATVFGIHLIRALSVKPGTKKWTDVRDPLRTAMTEQLFQQVATKQLATAKIEFTGKAPFIKPGTTELVTPGG